MKKKLLIILLFVLVNNCLAQTYKDPDAPVDERVQDLLNRMTYDEKFQYIGGKDAMYIRNIDRLDLPAIKMSDGPVGVRSWGSSTAYPAGIAMAATWDTSLVFKEGASLGQDCRARGVHILLAPGVNIYRAPMCGRNFEYYGEDPFLASRMAVAHIKGVQSENVVSTVKHFAANNQEWDRYSVSSDIDTRTLHEIYFPAFRAAACEAKAGAVMSSYNLLNGTYASHSNWLLRDVLKEQWVFNGFVMSDWGAVHNAFAAAKGGLDLEMPSGMFMNKNNLTPYINNLTLGMSEIDDKVRRILYTIFRFGFFDSTQLDPSIPLDNPESARVALDAARSAIVLLKNDSILPFDTNKISSIAIIGELGNEYVAGGGSSYANPFHYVSVCKGIDSLFGSSIEINYCSDLPEDIGQFSNSVFYTDSTLTTEGLVALYYDNMTLSSGAVDTEIDTIINFDWQHWKPDVEGISYDKFSIRWNGYISPLASGEYVFTVSGDDGYRLKLNDEIIIELWNDHAEEARNAIVNVESGHKYKIELEYYENIGLAVIKAGYSLLDNYYNEVAQIAAGSDAAIVCVGYNSGSETENMDKSYELPLPQEKTIQAVAEANENTVVLLFSGGSVATENWIDSTGAFMHVFFPGQEGGLAIAEVLFGKVNPSGKLPFSWERKWEDSPVYESYYDANHDYRVEYTEGIFMGYRYYDTSSVKPLYPFGYGLSYTSFEYSDLQIHLEDTNSLKKVDITFKIKNTGDYAGAEVAQLYIRDPESKVERPYKELKGFTKITLNPGETNTATIKLGLDAFKYYREDIDGWYLEHGDFVVLIGASSQDIRLIDTISIKGNMITPQLIKLSPADDSHFIDPYTAFSVEFAENVICIPNNINLLKYDNDELVETFTVNDLTGCDSNVISFESLDNLEYNTMYYIEIDSGIFINNYGKEFEGIKDKNTWNFKTMQEPVGISVYSDDKVELNLYPNPFCEEINILLDIENEQKIFVEIMDILGQTVFHESANLVPFHHEIKLNTSSLNNGTYLIKIKGKEFQIIREIIKVD